MTNVARMFVATSNAAIAGSVRERKRQKGADLLDGGGGCDADQEIQAQRPESRVDARELRRFGIEGHEQKALREEHVRQPDHEGDAHEARRHG